MIRYMILTGLTLFVVWGVIQLCQEKGRHSDKIWLHRCNSMEKLREKQAEYPNVEIDVIFRKDGRLDVTHDQEVSFNQDLEEYFAYMQGKEGKMWLDVKNLTLKNATALLARLNELILQYQIDKDRLIIESPCWAALSQFTQEDYYTSLYVAYDKPARMTDSEIATCIQQLKAIVDKKVVEALSFPYWWYTTIKKNLNDSIDLLTWKHRSTELQLLFSPMGWTMLNDPQLKVILVKDKGNYHR